MTVWLYARFDCYRLGAHSMTVTESSAGTALIALPASAGARFYHGDSTDNTGDGRLPTDGGTVNLGAYLQSLLNSAGLANTYTVTWAPTTGLYTIARATGTATFALTFSTLDAAGLRMRRVLGFSGDQSTATTHTSTQSCWYWYAFDGAASNDSGRQMRSEMQRANVAVSGNRQVFKTRPYSLPYGRTWTQEFQSHAQAFDSLDTTGGDVWTLERLFEHLIDERFLFFPSTTTVFAYRNRQGVYELSEQGIADWKIRRRIPNSDLYWEVDFDVIEWDTNDPEGSDPTLFQWADLTFTRSTVAMFQTSAYTLDDAAINELRYEDRGDGYGPLALFEGARTNLSVYSQSNWQTVGSPTVTNNGALAPDGTVIAELVVFAASSGTNTGDQIYQDWAGTSGTTYTHSVWIKRISGGTQLRLRWGCGTAFATEKDTTDYYSQIADVGAASATATGYAGPGTRQDASEPALSAVTAHVWGNQVEAGRFPSSPIRTLANTAETRAADTATLATASVPLTMKSGVWQVAVCPEFANTDLVSGDIFVLVSFDDANNSLRIRHDGSNVLVEAYQASTVRAASQALTFSRHQRLLITVNAPAATITVTGASTGNGAGSAGTAWAWACATAIRIGGNYSGTAEAFCRFELPRAA